MCTLCLVYHSYLNTSSARLSLTFSLLVEYSSSTYYDVLPQVVVKYYVVASAVFVSSAAGARRRARPRPLGTGAQLLPEDGKRYHDSRRPAGPWSLLLPTSQLAAAGEAHRHRHTSAVPGQVGAWI